MARKSITFNWRGLECEAKGFYTPGDPGRLSGPPEKCYPAEPAEFEIHELTCNGFNLLILLESTLDEEINEAILESFEEPEWEDPFEDME